MSTSEEHSGTACVLLGLSHGATASSSSPEQPPSPTETDPRWAASGSAIKSYALLTATKRQTQAAALPRKEWSPHEDELIRKGVEQLGCRWRVIAAQLPGRSDDAVRNRWSRLQDTIKGRANARDGNSSKRGLNGAGDSSGGVSSGAGADGQPRGLGIAAWRTDAPPLGAEPAGNGGSRSPESPRMSMPGEGGVSGSTHPAARMVPAGGITAKPPSASGSSGGSAGGGGSSFRKERSSWTRAEDDIIVQGVAELGHKWFEIARRLPGRTDHAIRNRWSRLQSILLQQDASPLLGGLGASALSPRLGDGSASMHASNGGSLLGYGGAVLPPSCLPSSSCASVLSADDLSPLSEQDVMHHVQPASLMEHMPMRTNLPPMPSMEHDLLLHQRLPPLTRGASAEENLLPTATAELSSPDAPPAGPFACEATIASATVATLDASAVDPPIPPPAAGAAGVLSAPLGLIISPSSTGTENSPATAGAEAPVAAALQEGALLLAVSTCASFDAAAPPDATQHLLDGPPPPSAPPTAAPAPAPAGDLPVSAAGTANPDEFVTGLTAAQAADSADLPADLPAAAPPRPPHRNGTRDGGERGGPSAFVACRNGSAPVPVLDTGAAPSRLADRPGLAGERERGDGAADVRRTAAVAATARAAEGGEQPDGSLPEGSAELLLLRKRARVTA